MYNESNYLIYENHAIIIKFCQLIDYQIFMYFYK